MVNPRADSDNTISSTPVSRRCRFFTICGANEASMSRGTSISTGPISVSTVLRPHPVAGVAAVAADRIVLVIAEMLRHLLLQRGLQHPFGQLVQQPVRADQLDALAPWPAPPAARPTLLIEAGSTGSCPAASAATSSIVSVMVCLLSDSDQPVPPFTRQSPDPPVASA